VKISVPLQILTFVLVALILFSSMTAIAATNTVPETGITLETIPISLNDQKPSSCAGLFVTNLITGSGTITGTSGNDLILGSSSMDTIDGLGGDDCIVGGGGDDLLTGGDGNDICLGGPGTDTFATCEGESQ
jgi:hypothetical protein